MSTEPRYQVATRDRETGEVHVSDASALLVSELTPPPDGSEHHAVSVRGAVTTDARLVVRLLAVLVRRLAKIMRIRPPNLALATLYEVMRMQLVGRDADSYDLKFGRRAHPPERPDA